MAGALKIAARVEIDASQVPQGARAVSAGIETIGTAANQTQSQLQQLIATSTGLHSGTANQNSRSWTGALAAEGLALDNLRAKYNPLFAVIQSYKEAQVEIRTALAMGAISSDEYSAAMARERQATRASIDAIKGRDAALQQAMTAAYGAELDRLKAKFDPLYAAQQRYKAVIQEIAVAERAGVISASQAIDVRLRETASYNAQISTLERLGSARKASAQAMVDNQSIRPDRAADIEAYGRSLDTLRARYNPLYQVTTQYKAVQAEIRNAHAIGAISTDEMTAALSRERQATLASIQAIKGRNAAMGGAREGQFRRQNLGYQGFDIGQGLASGMPLGMIAAQQLPQIAQLYAGQGGVKAALGDVAGIARGVITTFGAMPLAILAAGGAAITFAKMTESSAKTADEAIENHTKTIRSIKGAYGEAATALDNYTSESQIKLEAAARANLKIQQDTAAQAAKEFSITAGVLPARTGGASDIKAQFQPFSEAIRELRSSMAAGKPDFDRFEKSVNAIAATDPKGLRETADELINNSTAASEAQRRVQSAKEAISLLGGIASGQIADVKSLTAALSQLAGIAVPALSNADSISLATRKGLTALSNNGTMNEEARRRVLVAQAQAQLRSENANPTLINVDGDRASVPAPEARPITLGDKPEKVSGEVKSAANAYRDLIKSADDRIAQMKLEAQLSGETGIASDTLRFKLDLLQQSEDKGRSLSPKQVEAINSRVEAFKKYAEEATKAKLKADLLFDRDQLGRSGFDQQIAGQLRSSGLAIDFDSYEAGLIRTNLQMGYLRDTAGEFSSTFLNGLEQGKSAWAAFGDAGLSVLKKISDTLLNDVLNSIFQVQGAAGGSGGGFFSNLFGGLFGGGGSKAPSFLNNGFDTSPMAKFDVGGYTGPGGRFEPRGIVHAGEVVFSQADVARNGGVAAVEALRLGMGGYASGGVVDVDPLMSRQQSQAQSSGNSVMTLLIKLGLDADAELNLRPFVKDVVAQDAPGLAMKVVDDYRDRGLADDVLGVMDNPRVRGNG